MRRRQRSRYEGVGSARSVMLEMSTHLNAINREKDCSKQRTEQISHESE